MNPKTKTRGRPMVKKADKIITKSIGFKEQEWEEIKTAAKARSLHPSTYVRFVIMRVIRAEIDVAIYSTREAESLVSKLKQISARK